MAKIIGNTTATTMPKPDWNQTDETKADYIKNKPDVASYEKHAPISIAEIGESDTPNAISELVSGDAVTLRYNQEATYNINYQGDVDFVITGDASQSRRIYIYVDGNLNRIDSSTGVLEWKGNVKEGISIKGFSGHVIVIQRFLGDKYTNGFMTGKQVEKLNSTEVFTAEEKAKLGNFDAGEAYTKDESNRLLNVHDIAYQNTFDLQGDELEGKKDSANIHVMSTTNGNAVKFDDTYTHTGRYFGYVGVKNVTSGKHILVAEIDIDTDFNMSKARVQGYYQPVVGGSNTPEGVVIGVPMNGKNIIVYTFEGSADKPVRGFYIDAQGSNTPTVKLTLRDVRLYTPVDIDFNIGKNVNDWKCQVYGADKFVVSDLDAYGIISTSTSTFVSSFSNSMSADVVLYTSNDDVFANKNDVNEELGVLANAVLTKGLSFEQYPAGTKIPLQPGCLYYLRCNSDTMYYYINGSKISQYTSAFGDGLVMMADNLYQGSHVNFFAAPSSGFMDFSMNGYTISTKDTDDVYAMSSSAVVNVWKVKA